jgi:N-acetylglucosamine-6-phosphate deacetylase
MDRTVRTMVQQVGVPLPEAVRMATATPAAIGGFRKKGRIAAGFDADLVLFNEQIEIQLTMIGGRIIYQC